MFFGLWCVLLCVGGGFVWFSFFVSFYFVFGVCFFFLFSTIVMHTSNSERASQQIITNSMFGWFICFSLPKLC